MNMNKQSDTLVKLVQLLSTDARHDGNALGKKLGITRSAVWKSIKKLQAYGVDIKAVKGKGYALLDALELYQEELILAKLADNKNLAALIALTIFESIPSTMTYLKTIDFSNKIAVCVAEEQTAGRGRFARYWHSPFGQNIYLSIGFSFAKDISGLMGISLVIGLAVLSAIKEYGIAEKIVIKWPNDILYDNKKLAGILIDANAEINGNCKLIIGVGVNLNMTKAIDLTNSNEIKPWTSLKKIVGQTIDKNKMVALLISNIFAYVRKFEILGLAVFVEQWDNHDYLRGKAITIGSGNQDEAGIGQGIDQQGRLVLQLSNGVCKAFASGDATVSNVHVP